jgi:O-antigen/teichoic acid export membrane protein
MRRVARNAVFNFAGQALPLGVGFLTIPFTLRWLGPELFGLLALVWVILGYLNVFDLGLGRATTRFVALAVGGDERAIPSLVGTAAAVQVILGTVAGIVIWIGAPPFVDRVLSLPPDIAHEARDAFSLLALSVPLLLLSTSLRGTLEAAQRFDLVNTVRAPLGVMHFLLAFVGAGAGWPLPRIVLCMLLLQTAAAVGQYLMCVRVFPGMRRPRVEFRTLGRLLSFGGWVAVSGVVGPVLVYLDRFVIAVLLSLTAVGHYAAPYEIVTRLSIIPVSLVAALFPVFSANHEAPRDIEALATRSLKILLWVMGGATVLLVALAGDVVRIWLGPELVSIVTVPVQILAVGVLVNALSYVPYSLLQAVGRPDVTGKLHLVELPLHLLLVWVLVDAFGLVGAALAWSIRVTIDGILLFVTAARLGPLRFASLRSSGAPVLAAWVGFLSLAAVGISVIPSFPFRVSAVLLVLGVAATKLIQAGPANRLGWLPIGSSSRT